MLNNPEDNLKLYLINSNLFFDNENKLDLNKIDATIDLIRTIKSVGENLKKDIKSNSLNEKGWEKVKQNYYYLRKIVPKELNDKILLELSKKI